MKTTLAILATAILIGLLCLMGCGPTKAERKLTDLQTQRIELQNWRECRNAIDESKWSGLSGDEIRQQITSACGKPMQGYDFAGQPITTK